MSSGQTEAFRGLTPPRGEGNPPLGFTPARNDWLIKGIRFCAIIEDPVNVKMHTISFIFHLRTRVKKTP